MNGSGDEFKISPADDALDRRLSRALEAVPQIAVADGFARQVMQRVPERGWTKRVAPTLPTERLVRPARVARRVGLAALVVLVVGMLALVPSARGTGHAASLTVEWMFCLEFIGITLWMTVAPHRQR